MRGSILRETSRVTRLLVLAEVRDRRPSKLRPVAEALGVTPQAVSSYMRDLEAEGLVTEVDGAHVLTRTGMQTLQEGLQDLKRAVDETVSRHAAVELTAAVADAPLEAGDPVGLVLRDGLLRAVPGLDTGSTGRVLRDAAEGEDVAVHDLEGVVDLAPGTLRILRVPDVTQGGTRRVDLASLRQQLDDGGLQRHRVGALGIEARVIVGRLGLPVDLEFAPVAAAHHACTLGLDVLLVISEDRLPDATAELDALAKTALEPVPVRIHRAPEA